MNTDEKANRRNFYLFKKQVRLAVKAANDLKVKTISFNLNYKEEVGGDVSVSLPNEKEIARFAVIIHPLVADNSEINIKAIAAKLLIYADEEERADISSTIMSFEKLEKGIIKVIHKNNDYTAKEMFSDASKGYFFAQNKLPNTISSAFTNPILSKFLIFNFYNYCMDGYRLSISLLHHIYKISPKRRSIIDKVEAEKCIFCKRTDRLFTSFEHIFPESLGNVELVLKPGVVCDICNNGILSRLDNHLVEFDAINFLRTLHLPYNPKTGKFPSANFQNMEIEKIHPQKVIIKTRHNKYLKFRREGDLTHITGTFIGRKKFSPKIIARSLYKIALEIIAHTEGAEKALDTRYDKARKFILEGGDFKNYMAMNTQINTEDVTISYHYQPLQQGSAFGLGIFGLIFLFNLEEDPVFRISAEVEEFGFKIYPLFG
jgi:hypothetical protein